MKVKTKVILSLVSFATVAVKAAKEIYIIVSNNDVALAEINKEIRLAEINKEIAINENNKAITLVEISNKALPVTD